VSDTGMKVIDKRMFNADGDLREEYRFLEEPPQPAAPQPAAPEPARAAAPAPVAADPLVPEVEDDEAAGGPGFLDLLAMLAEPIAMYLGDVPLPNGRSGLDLELARAHIDLLHMLKRKTAGNLSTQEARVLDDLLYQLRARLLQKRG
jgi:hypothetical protein